MPVTFVSIGMQPYTMGIKRFTIEKPAGKVSSFTHEIILNHFYLEIQYEYDLY